MKLFRITRARLAGDVFSGRGAALFGSRWSSPGYPVIYCSASSAAALAEIQVWNDTFDTSVPKQDLMLATIDVPDHISRSMIRRSDLPHDESGDVDFAQTRAIGNNWIAAGTTCMLLVPSRRVPGTFVYVINPRHRDFEDITVLGVARVAEGASDVAEHIAEHIDRRLVFLCHASEDKERVVRPVKEALFANGINSWIDDAEITLGDSITRKVNTGLKDAEYVIVFISPAFIRKPWPRRELDAALSREARTGRR
jgi:RES domain-containing protein